MDIIPTVDADTEMTNDEKEERKKNSLFNDVAFTQLHVYGYGFVVRKRKKWKWWWLDNVHVHVHD